jgi:hypothetical protein
MPNTLIAIQTYTITSDTAAVTFSNIPQNYADLKLVVCARTGRDSYADDLRITINNNTSATYTTRRMYGNGSSTGADGGSATGLTWAYSGISNATTSTTGVYSNTEFYFPNYTSSIKKLWSSDGVAENNNTATQLGFTSNSCSDTNPITSITIDGYNAPRTVLAGSTFTLYGISNGVKATGGTLTVAGGYAIHTFTSTGSFLPTQQIKGADFLVVAGGGSGGQNNSGAGSGGGGAGGYRTSAGTSGANSGAENKLNLIAGNSYTVIVGAGGAALAIGANSNGNNGTASSFSNITSTGGGGGGGVNSSSASVGNSGGSGGGANPSTVSTTGGAGTANQGFAGGTAGVASGIDYSGGGGGGAGAVGGNKADYLGGAGGAGLSSFITGTTTFYAGGGGGATYGASYAAGGVGGGGAGAPSSNSPAGIAGTANTGGGGGGVYGGGNASGAGGSGIVIIRYPLS